MGNQSANTRATGPNNTHSLLPGRTSTLFYLAESIRRQIPRLSHPLPEDRGLLSRKPESELPDSKRLGWHDTRLVFLCGTRAFPLGSILKIYPAPELRGIECITRLFFSTESLSEDRTQSHPKKSCQSQARQRTAGLKTARYLPMPTLLDGMRHNVEFNAGNPSVSNRANGQNLLRPRIRGLGIILVCFSQPSIRP